MTVKTFKLGKVYGVLTNIPLQGERSFDSAKEIFELMTGIPCPCQKVPEFTSTENVELVMWRMFCHTACADWLQIMLRLQTRHTDKLLSLDFTKMQQMALLNIREAVEMVKDTIAEAGIDLEVKVEIRALPSSVQEGLATAYKSDTFRQSAKKAIQKELMQMIPSRRDMFSAIASLFK